MSRELQLAKIKRDRETKEEEIVPFFIHEDRIQCLYKDRNGVFIVDKRGFLNKVPYKLSDLQELLGL